jgi:HK97 family phage major capsid protein
MLASVKISRRQSEIRQSLAELSANDNLTEDQRRSLEGLDKEYRDNEVRYRAALIAEDTERREAGAELETRSGREWSALMRSFEVRQVANFFDEGRALSGQTAEIVAELRSKGSYRGIPLPLAALETRAGETVASGTPDLKFVAPFIDRLFAAGAAARMGAQIVAIDAGLQEYPVTTSSVAAGWQADEVSAVAGPTVFATTDRPLAPEHTLGVQMKITRRALKQSGDALEQAVRRDMLGAINVAMDKAVFLGTGATGQPLGVIAGAATYGITATAINAAASWSAFRAAVARFLIANAATGPGDVRLMIRPEIWSALDNTLISGTAVSEWDRLTAQIPAANVVLSSNALAAPAGSPAESSALLTTSAGGVAPIFVGVWGAIDVIRDPYSDAASGMLRLTGLMTADVTISRTAQLEVLNELQ